MKPEVPLPEGHAPFKGTLDGVSVEGSAPQEIIDQWEATGRTTKEEE